MKYVLMEYADHNNYTASSKARNDAVRILRKKGAVYIPLFKAKSGHLSITISILKQCISSALRLQKGDVVFIQYPYNPQIVNKVLIQVLSLVTKRKKSNLCILIHDINSFRFTDRNKKSEKLRQEATLLNKADHVIAHNDKMIRLLQTHGCRTQLHNLGYFDYLYDGIMPDISISSKVKIIIAGNLSSDKSGYIYNLPEDDMLYKLYGVNYEKELDNNCNTEYKGSYSPEELIPHLEGSFGLVWDGPSIHTCYGNYGTYLRYNDPHKFSLYIAAGIPVIVWKESAMAEVVERNHIGLSIKSISEISNVVRNVSIQEYNNMRTNVYELREKVISGQKLSRIIDEIDD